MNPCKNLKCRIGKNRFEPTLKMTLYDVCVLTKKKVTKKIAKKKTFYKI